MNARARSLSACLPATAFYTWRKPTKSIGQWPAFLVILTASFSSSTRDKMKENCPVNAQVTDHIHCP
jgi:hypothetical protein